MVHSAETTAMFKSQQLGEIARLISVITDRIR